MDSIPSDDMEEQLYTPYLHGIYGEPELLPRVGDHYQADIPPLLPQHDRVHSDPNLLTYALPIPLMWTRSDKFRGFREPETAPLPKPVPPARINLRSVVLALPCQRNAKFKFGLLDNTLYPFPGTLGESSWQDFEIDRFLLGLYCIGKRKNLAAVQQLVETKQMGDVLSYYYGTFYNSVHGRKLRSRRCVRGQRLLTGWRQQELLSRISPLVPEECKTTLLKVAKEIREEKIKREEYVFTLEKMVGIDALVEAFGIGKEKRDLTNSALEPTKSNHGASRNSEVRIHHDLLVDDIVKFLKGEYRMSKARSTELFWEAVWPRLLARGWHSEQPKDGLRNSLVFLIPDANKFSRRKMTKGKDYFDSPSDVLKHVASDTKLLYLETDEDQERKESKQEEVKTDPPIKLEEVECSSPNSKRKYLQPRSKTSKSQEVTMFMIVDTSKANGREGCALKELRSLPVENGCSVANSPSCLSESEDNVSEESENKAETTTKVCGGGSISSGKSSSVNMDNATSRGTISLNEGQQKNRKGRPPKLLPVHTKRSSLADCALRESGCFGETQSRKKRPVKKRTQMRSNPPETDQNIVLMRDDHIDQDQTMKLSSTSSIAEDSSCGRNEDREISLEKPETREDFDLNVSQISLEHEAEGDVTVITDVVHNSESSCSEQSSVQMDVEVQCKPQEMHVTADPLPELRQSRRTRPLTTKALEAIAYGLLGDSKKKRKGSEDSRSRSRTKSKKRIRRHSELRNGTIEDGSNTDENE